MQRAEQCIVIDVGNTRGKVAVFDRNEMVGRWTFNTDEDLSPGKWKDREFMGHRAILSTVRPLKDDALAFLEDHYELLILDGSTPLPFESAYATPESLGTDRIALAAGALMLYPGKDVLVIDAGTCITMDFILGGGRYLGGSISPGIDMRLRSLHEFTGALPLIEKEDGAWFPGTSTRDSILSGVIEGVCLEIDGRVDALKHTYPEMKLILTGGDAPYFVKNLKNSIFASPDLVLQGLRKILDHYVETSH